MTRFETCYLKEQNLHCIYNTVADFKWHDLKKLSYSELYDQTAQCSILLNYGEGLFERGHVYPTYTILN